MNNCKLDELSAWLYEQGMPDLITKASLFSDSSVHLNDVDSEGLPTEKGYLAKSHLSQLRSSLAVFKTIEASVNMLAPSE